MPAFKTLKGKTLLSVEKTSSHGDDRITFTTARKSYLMYHSQDCCESVAIEDINGDLDDLIGSPILFAEESTSGDDPEGYPERDYKEDSQTWTFYRIGTIKGTVVIRWYGSSNGYYSESVQFEEVIR